MPQHQSSENNDAQRSRGQRKSVPRAPLADRNVDVSPNASGSQGDSQADRIAQLEAQKPKFAMAYNAVEEKFPIPRRCEGQWGIDRIAKQIWGNRKSYRPVFTPRRLTLAVARLTVAPTISPSPLRRPPREPRLLRRRQVHPNLVAVPRSVVFKAPTSTKTKTKTTTYSTSTTRSDSAPRARARARKDQGRSTRPPSKRRRANARVIIK
ncbi:hypothetical protein DFH06DRAFT_1249889 [Mycena polygramma]|nr:hypothetical protein DFH06DRAFT_1249889 [Mycena polygramma]